MGELLKATNKVKDYEYINKLPDKWEILPNFAIFEERSSKGYKDKELLSVTIGNGISKQSEIDKKDNSNLDKSNYKLVKKGDIAYNKMRMWQGAVGYSEYNGIVSPAYIILKPKKKINPKYFHYLFRTKYYNNYSKRYSYGLCDDQLNLRYNDFKHMYSIVPPLKTQNKIVDFLDKQKKRDEKFIKNQERIIELLKEQKKSIITKAITEGIDSDTKLKDTDIKFLGEIPDDWEISKIKFISKLNPSKEKCGFSNNSDLKVTFLPMEAVSETGEISTEYKRPIKELWSGYTFFAKNDILLAKITPCFENGKGAYLNNLDTSIGFGTTEFHVLRARKNVHPEFLFYSLRTHKFKEIGKEHMSGTAGQKRLPLNFLANYPIALPSFNEQKRIVNFIKSKIKNIEEAIKKAEKEKNKIRKHLDSIMYYYVTGQISIEDD